MKTTLLVISLFFLVPVSALNETLDTLTGCSASFTYTMLRCMGGESNLKCGPNSYRFYIQSVGNPVFAHWDFGDGTTSYEFNPDHYFPGPGSYNVCLTLENSDSCISSYCETINIPVDSVACYAAFYYYSDFADCPYPEKCVGSETTIRFVNQSSENITQWFWEFGDGTTSEEKDPVHEFDSAGVYLVCLNVTSEDSCFNYFCDYVYVGTEPCRAHFKYCIYSNLEDPSQAQVSDTNDYFVVVFRDFSQGVGNYWWWDFGDSLYSSAQNPIHIYSSPGMYNVCLTVGSNTGCYDTYCETIYIGPVGCEVDFTYVMLVGNCLIDEKAYVFYPELQGPYWAIEWDFGDGTTSNDEVAAKIYELPGLYNVCVRVYYDNNCIAEVCKEILVDEIIWENFRYEKCIPNDLPGIPAEQGLTLTGVYPNPANEYLNIVLKSPGNMNIKVEFISLTGLVLYSGMYSIGAGENKLDYDLTKFESGYYLCVIYSENGMVHQRINIVR